MKKIILFFSLINFVHAQTSVPAGNVSGTWNLAGSPYNVMGGIMVAAGNTLVIDPGVTVNFQGHYKLLVKGTLVAIGAPGNEITFTASNTATGWYGLRIDSPALTQDSSLLKYCKFEWGLANGSGDDDKGGGVFVKNFSKVSINSCTLTNNTANSTGGGLYATGSNIIIANNTVSNNNGGGMFIFDGNLSITRNQVLNNNQGGISIMSSATATVSVISNTISGNNTGNNGLNPGGGIYLGTSGTVANNLITNNISNYNGGGLYILSPGATVTNNTFMGNQALFGGAISLLTTPVLFSNNLIINNTGTTYGGGIVMANLSQGTPTLINNVIANNETPADGGALWLSGSNAVMTNNTIANNKAANGGAIYCMQSSKPILKNCILFGNVATASGNQVFLSDEPSDPNFGFCDIDGGQAAFGLNGNFFTGAYTSCINSSPLFVSPSGAAGAQAGSLSDNWRLSSGSPCINTGNPTGPYPATDIDNNTRIAGGIIDMGAYEYGGSTTVGIAAHYLDNGLGVYPNPFTTSTVVRLPGSASGDLEIYNMTGQLLSHETVSNTEYVTVERRNLAPGIYQVKWTNQAGQSFWGKIIAE